MSVLPLTSGPGPFTPGAGANFMPVPPLVPFGYGGSVPALIQPPEQNTNRGYDPIGQFQTIDRIQINSQTATTHREAPHAPSIVLPTIIPVSSTQQARNINSHTSQCDVLFISKGHQVESGSSKAQHYCFPAQGLNWYLQGSVADKVSDTMYAVKNRGLLRGIPEIGDGSLWSETELNKYLLMLPRDGDHPLGKNMMQAGTSDVLRHSTAHGILNEFRMLGAITAPSHDMSSASGSSNAPPFGGATSELHHSVAATEQMTVKNLWGKLIDGTKIGFAVMRVYIGDTVNDSVTMNQKDWTPCPLLVPVTFQGVGYRIPRIPYLGHGNMIEIAPVLYLGEVRLLNSSCTSTPEVRRIAAGLPGSYGDMPSLDESFEAANGLDTIQIYRSPAGPNPSLVYW